MNALAKQILKLNYLKWGIVQPIRIHMNTFPADGSQK